MLLSHYFFKDCGFRTNIKLYMKDYCKVKGYDYETCIMKDRYWKDIKIKDIKLIITENAKRGKGTVEMILLK